MFQNESDIYPYSVTDLSPKDALILAPHPDDESLGCGGSIAKHISRGSRVKVIFITDGDKGDFEGKFDKDYVQIRRQNAQKAMEILGVKDYEFWGYRDRNLHLMEEEVVDRLLHVVEVFSPSLIYMPSPYEAHPDHKATSKIAMRIFKKTGITVLLYEVLMALYPNILVDITLEMERKKKAIESYYTEAYYNDYISKIEGLNRFRTATLPNTVAFAEGFVLLDKEVSIKVLSLQLLSRLLD
jgi:LmbE family N-acetylglucosaminyl deacetylase